ncbi:MAG: hypothetical protein H6R19_1703 [Proteobacteria bacterium]|nr:hypothetical protein [Pseudomonadota bacterium]
MNAFPCNLKLEAHKVSVLGTEFMNALGWKAVVELEAGIQQAFEAYCGN